MHPVIKKVVLAVVFLFTCCLYDVSAQKKFRAKGKAEILLEDNMTKEQARNKVRELAMVNAIEGVFGTYIEQESQIRLEDGDLSFRTVGSNKVKGEWLETKDEQFDEVSREIKDRSGDEVEVWIVCEISGTVREIVKPRLAIKIQPLNCPQSACRTDSYFEGEYFYLHFQSPSDGFLTVYLTEDDEAFRILPYGEMSGKYASAIPITADKEYVFFSQDPKYDYFSDFPPSLVDELEMFVTEGKGQSSNMDLYVIFSTEGFDKPLLSEGKEVEGGSMPKTLSYSQFEKWITNNRIFNNNFNYETKVIEIRKK